MGFLNWIPAHWLDLIQSIGILGGLLFSAYTTRTDVRARRIANSIAINEQHREIWDEVNQDPGLSRVLAKNVDLTREPISDKEELFITNLILHLSTVYRAIANGEFVKLEGLQKDVKDFISLPIPKAVWEKLKPLQDRNFVSFLESALQK